MAHTAQLRGASINVPSFGTPLTIYATIKPGTDMLKFLISNGAEVNQSMPNGYTPLMSAAFLGHADQVQLLLRAGANSNLHDSNKWTAADWARNGVSPDLANLLEHPTPAPPPSANRTAIISSTDGGTLAISFRS
jgi:ankyrin repeat protein